MHSIINGELCASSPGRACTYWALYFNGSALPLCAGRPSKPERAGCVSATVLYTLVVNSAPKRGSGAADSLYLAVPVVTRVVTAQGVLCSVCCLAAAHWRRQFCFVTIGAVVSWPSELSATPGGPKGFQLLTGSSSRSVNCCPISQEHRPPDSSPRVVGE